MELCFSISIKELVFAMDTKNQPPQCYYLVLPPLGNSLFLLRGGFLNSKSIYFPHQRCGLLVRSELYRLSKFLCIFRGF